MSPCCRPPVHADQLCWFQSVVVVVASLVLTSTLDSPFFKKKHSKTLSPPCPSHSGRAPNPISAQTTQSWGWWWKVGALACSGQLLQACYECVKAEYCSFVLGLLEPVCVMQALATSAPRAILHKEKKTKSMCLSLCCRWRHAGCDQWGHAHGSARPRL